MKVEREELDDILNDPKTQPISDSEATYFMQEIAERHREIKERHQGTGEINLLANKGTFRIS